MLGGLASEYCYSHLLVLSGFGTKRAELQAREVSLQFSEDTKKWAQGKEGGLVPTAGFSGGRYRYTGLLFSYWVWPLTWTWPSHTQAGLSNLIKETHCEISDEARSSQALSFCPFFKQRGVDGPRQANSPFFPAQHLGISTSKCFGLRFSERWYYYEIHSTEKGCLTTLVL